MKKKVNVIQIKGIRGIIAAIFIVSCLIAGFVAFPAIVCTKAWNFLALNIDRMPTIGVLQGLLLWAIMVVSYFVFRKEKVVVCMKSPEGLNEEELKAVFADLKKQSQEDPIIHAMMKARESELKLQATEKIQPSETESTPVNTEK